VRVFRAVVHNCPAVSGWVGSVRWWVARLILSSTDQGTPRSSERRWKLHASCGWLPTAERNSWTADFAGVNFSAEFGRDVLPPPGITCGGGPIRSRALRPSVVAARSQRSSARSIERRWGPRQRDRETGSSLVTPRACDEGHRPAGCRRSGYRVAEWLTSRCRWPQGARHGEDRRRVGVAVPSATSHVRPGPILLFVRSGFVPSHPSLWRAGQGDVA